MRASSIGASEAKSSASRAAWISGDIWDLPPTPPAPLPRPPGGRGEPEGSVDTTAWWCRKELEGAVDTTAWWWRRGPEGSVDTTAWWCRKEPEGSVDTTAWWCR